MAPWGGPRSPGIKRGTRGCSRGFIYEMPSQIFLSDSQGPLGAQNEPTGPLKVSPLLDYLMTT